MRRGWIWRVIPLLAAIAVFWPVVRFRFVEWDDWTMLTENVDFNPVNWGALGKYWASGHLGLYAPLTYCAWGALAMFSRVATGGFSPAVFHAANLTCHVAAVMLVYELLIRLGAKAAAACMGVIVFAIHPVQVEPVCWIASFNTVLSGAMGIGAILLYVIHAQGGEWKWYAAATVALLLALFAKPSAVVIPLVAMVVDVGVVGRPWRKAMISLAPWVVVAVIFGIVGRAVQPATAVWNPPVWARPIVALDAIAFYMGKIVAPWRLSVDYGRTPQWLMESTQVWWTWAAAVAVFAVAIALRRRWGWGFVLWGLLIVVASIAPVLGLTTFEFQGYSTVADRYLYVGMVGVAIAVALGLSRAQRREAWMFCAVVVALYAARSEMAVWVWRDTFALTDNALKVDAESYAGNKVRAYALAREGRVDEAVEYYQRSLKLPRGDMGAEYQFANALMQMGRAEAAAQIYGKLVSQRPNDVRLRNNYGIALMMLKRVDEAGEQFRKAVELGENVAESHANLGVWYEKQHKLEEARNEYQRALEIDPQMATARNGMARIGPAKIGL